MRLGPWPAAIARAAIGLAVALSLGHGARAVRADLRLAFRSAPRSVFSPEFRAQREQVMRILPPGETLLHFSAAPESWYSRLWQRALYPRNWVVVVDSPIDGERLRNLRAQRATRFAISVGNPPIDPGYRFRVELRPLVGQAETWFGELAP